MDVITVAYLRKAVKRGKELEQKYNLTEYEKFQLAFGLTNFRSIAQKRRWAK